MKYMLNIRGFIINYLQMLRWVFSLEKEKELIEKSDEEIKYPFASSLYNLRCRNTEHVKFLIFMRFVKEIVFLKITDANSFLIRKRNVNIFDR